MRREVAWRKVCRFLVCQLGAQKYDMLGKYQVLYGVLQEAYFCAICIQPTRMIRLNVWALDHTPCPSADAWQAFMHHTCCALAMFSV
jgi:hypothetical protein